MKRHAGQFFLGPLAVGDVLDLMDQQRVSPRIQNQRPSLKRPNGASIGPKPALFDAIAGNFLGEEPLLELGLDFPIFGMNEIRRSTAEKFLLVVGEEIAQSRIHGRESLLEVQQRHSDRGMMEGGPELLLAGLGLPLCSPATGDVLKHGDRELDLPLIVQDGSRPNLNRNAPRGRVELHVVHRALRTLHRGHDRHPFFRVGLVGTGYKSAVRFGEFGGADCRVDALSEQFNRGGVGVEGPSFLVQDEHAGGKEIQQTNIGVPRFSTVSFLASAFRHFRPHSWSLEYS